MQKEAIEVASLTVLRDLLANMTEIGPAFVFYQYPVVFNCMEFL
jgi:hypothetical protein